MHFPRAPQFFARKIADSGYEIRETAGIFFYHTGRLLDRTFCKILGNVAKSGVDVVVDGGKSVIRTIGRGVSSVGVVSAPTHLSPSQDFRISYKV